MYAVLILAFLIIAVVIIFKTQKGPKPTAASPARRPAPEPAAPAAIDERPTPPAITLKISVQGLQDGAPPKTEEPDDRDAWEDWTDVGYDPYQNGRVLKVPLLIEYRDKRGALTRREVVTERYVYDAADGLMHAFCKLRNGRRPFRFSRITKAIDSETGEVIADLRSWLDSRYEATDEFRFDQFIEQHTPALGLCQAMAKADGAFRAKEKELLALMCVKLGASEPVADLVVKAVLEWQLPSAVRVGRDIRALLLQPESEQQLAVDTLRQMIASDKTEREEERRLLDKVEKAIRTKKPDADT